MDGCSEEELSDNQRILTDLVDTVIITCAVIQFLHIKRHKHRKRLGKMCIRDSYSYVSDREVGNKPVG